MEQFNMPIYSTVIVTKNKSKISLNQIQLDFVLSENNKDLANKLNISIPNMQVNNKYLSEVIDVRDMIYAYADLGNGKKEVFRGYIWEIDYSYSNSKEIKFTAYDNLIYLQNSKENMYYSKGKSTLNLLKKIFNKWSIPLEYKYESITHPKLMFREKNLSDIIIEILEAVKKNSGKNYSIRCLQGKVIIEQEASNTVVYEFREKDNVINTSQKISMDGMVTKVIITGNEEKDKKPPVVAVVNGETSKYGTLQEIISKDKDTTLANAKKEAKTLLKEQGKPFLDASVEAMDIPWLHKGHKIKLNAGGLKGFYKVLGVEHDGHQKTMSLEVEKYNN